MSQLPGRDWDRILEDATAASPRGAEWSCCLQFALATAGSKQRGPELAQQVTAAQRLAIIDWQTF